VDKLVVDETTVFSTKCPQQEKADAKVVRKCKVNEKWAALREQRKEKMQERVMEAIVSNIPLISKMITDY
jgi:hypothetical protein